MSHHEHPATTTAPAGYSSPSGQAQATPHAGLRTPAFNASGTQRRRRSTAVAAPVAARHGGSAEQAGAAAHAAWKGGWSRDRRGWAGRSWRGGACCCCCFATPARSGEACRRVRLFVCELYCNLYLELLLIAVCVKWLLYVGCSYVRDGVVRVESLETAFCLCCLIDRCLCKESARCS